MTQQILHAQARRFKRSLPELKPGYTVRVREKLQEGGKERIQIFEGLVIGIHRGKSLTDAAFTVRRVVAGVGVEKVFPLCSPTIAGIDVVKVASVRRAKLSFLRHAKGKATKLSERFTKAEEFSIAVSQPVEGEDGKGMAEKIGEEDGNEGSL